LAAHPDFAYLRERAGSDADLRTLEEIIRLRDAVLRGKARASGEDQQEHCFELRLGGETLVMSRELAPAAVDTYLELFRDGAHQRHPEFTAAGIRRIVDVGANEGYYTLKMKRDEPQAEVVAIEPYPPAFELLKRNIAANGLTGVVPVRSAVIGLSGKADNVRDEEHPPHTVTLESYPHVSSVTSSDLLAFPRPWIDPQRIRRLTAPAAPLPELLDRHAAEWLGEDIDLLKIDTEGAELEVLRGAEDILPRISRIVVECHGRSLRQRCIRFLTARGFDLVMEEEKRSGDAYFLRQ
jgi:FkbM family methyltransferase